MEQLSIAWTLQLLGLLQGHRHSALMREPDYLSLNCYVTDSQSQMYKDYRGEYKQLLRRRTSHRRCCKYGTVCLIDIHLDDASVRFIFGFHFQHPRRVHQSH